MTPYLPPELGILGRSSEDSKTCISLRFLKNRFHEDFQVHLLRDANEGKGFKDGQLANAAKGDQSFTTAGFCRVSNIIPLYLYISFVSVSVNLCVHMCVCVIDLTEKTLS